MLWRLRFTLARGWAGNALAWGRRVAGCAPQALRRQRSGPVFVLFAVDILALGACERPSAAVGAGATDGCPTGEIRDDAGACVPAACGVGPFGENGDADILLEPGSDLQAAADELGAGTIALSAGIWPGSLSLTTAHEGLAIVGRCAQLVTIDAQYVGTPVVTMVGHRRTPFALAGVTLTGGAGLGLVADHTDSSFRDLVIADTADAGDDYGTGLMVVAGVAALDNVTIARSVLYGLVVVDGAEVSVSDVRVTDTTASRGHLGQAVYVGQASMTGTGLTIERNAGVGGYFLDAQVTLDDVEIRDPVAAGAEGTGMAVEVREGSAVRLDRLRVFGSLGRGIEVSDVNSSLDVRNSTISGTVPGDAGWNGESVVAMSGGHLELSDSRVSGVADADVRVLDGASAVLARVHLDGRLGVGEAHGSYGFTVEGGEAELHDVRIEHVDVGVVAKDGATLSAFGLIIDDVRGFAFAADAATFDVEDCSLSRGVAGEAVEGFLFGVLPGSSGFLRRCHLFDSTLGGVGVNGPDARLWMQDVEVSGIRPSTLFDYGAAIELVDGAWMDAERVIVSDDAGAGLSLHASEAHVRDLRVQGGARPAAEAPAGIVASEGSTLDGDDIVVETWSPYGLLALSAGTEVRASNVRISVGSPGALTSESFGSMASVGADLTLVDAAITGVTGPAIGAFGNGHVSCTRCALTGNQFAGATAVGGRLDLIDSSIDGTLPSASNAGGIGVYAAPGEGTTALTLDHVVIGAHQTAGVWVSGVPSVVIRNSTISGGEGVRLREDLTMQGDAVYVGAGGGTAWLSMHDTLLQNAAGAGLLLDGASADLGGLVWADNGIDIVQQRCGEPVDASSIPEARTSICSGADRLVVPLVFSPFSPDAPARLQ